MSKPYIYFSALVGVLCGFITIHSFLAQSWTSIIFWIIAGLLVLYFNPDRKTALYAGASFGFFNIAGWLISGFHGTANQLGGFTVLLIGFSILGGLCGMAGAFLFNKLFRKNHN
ncbi:MAG: hypothetical protein KGJ13_07325 [Patescibacteria group bacterium]|nr:hypothetical protein [Patescibacteria group bacterium]